MMIRDEDELEERLSRPRPELVEFIRTVSSPLVILGAGGKMGPTLAVLARRAALEAGHDLDVIAVSRFSDASARRRLESQGVRTLSADLFDREAVGALPESAEVIYLVGLKFGTSANPSLTWAANTLIPARVAERYARSRMVALSTGNVYPLVPVDSGGAREDHPLTPLGEYANAAVARERIFEHCAQGEGTRLALIRLNYAVEMRYGVLLDIARKVWDDAEIDLSTGYLNCIWQGDANDMILRSLALAARPPAAYNLTGAAVLSVRQLALRFAELMGRTARFSANESPTALLSNAHSICRALGPPPTAVEDVMAWTADWVRRGGRVLNRPTHFEVRDGRY